MIIVAKHLLLLCALYVNYTAAAHASSEPPVVPQRKMKGTGTAKESSKSKSPFIQLKEMFLLSNSMLDWSSSETIMYNTLAEKHHVPSSSSSSIPAPDSHAKGNKGIGKDTETRETEKNNGSIFLSNRLDARMLDFSSSAKVPTVDHKSPDFPPEEITNSVGLKACEKDQTCQESLLTNITSGSSKNINVERLDAFIEKHDGLFLWLAFGLVSIILIFMQVRYNVAKPRPKIKVKNWKAKVRNWDKDEAFVLRKTEAKVQVTTSKETIEVSEDVAETCNSTETAPKAEDNGEGEGEGENEPNLNVSLILETQETNAVDAEVESTRATWLSQERIQADVLVAKFKNEGEGHVTNVRDEVVEACPVSDTAVEAESIDTEKGILAEETDQTDGLIIDIDQKKEPVNVEKSPVRSTTSNLQADDLVARFKSEGAKRMAKKIEKGKVKDELQRLASRKTAKSK